MGEAGGLRTLPIQRVAELLRAAPAIGRELLQRGEDCLLHRGRHRLAAEDDGGGLLGHHLGNDGLRGGAAEGRLPGEHLVGDGAQGIHVAASADLALAHRLFGGHVARRAERHAGLGHAAAAGLLHGEGDAEVGDEGLAVVQQDVVGLDVAVDDAVAVGVVECAGDFLGETDGVVDGELFLAGEPVTEGLALDEGHDVEELAIGAAAVEQREDVGVLEIGGELDFLEEALGANDGRQFRVDDLDRDLAAMADILGEVDGGHAARPEFAFDAVAIAQGGRERGDGVGQTELEVTGRWDDTGRARGPPTAPEVSFVDGLDSGDPAKHGRLVTIGKKGSHPMRPTTFDSRSWTRIRRTLTVLLGAVVLAPVSRVLLAQAMTPLPAPTIPSTVPVAAATAPAATASTAPVQAAAQDTGAKIPAAQLDALVAPIALYPDPLLAQTLVASTYPLEIIQLQQWMAKHPGLKDKALADSVAKQPWDPSIQSMAAVPEVVKRLADDIQWTTELGNAFLAQQADVMDAVQRMRKKAKDKGALDIERAAEGRDAGRREARR